MRKLKTTYLARAAMTLLLAVLGSTGAWAQTSTLSGSGTQSDPYLIQSDTDWETFVGWINNQNSTYGNKYYKLTADINVSTMAGTSTSVYFGGTFDGDGHTMTLNLSASENEHYCAPFHYASYAKFRKLHVTGTINTAGRYAGGLVGYFISTYNECFSKCWSSVTINSTFSGYGYHGGFVGYNKSTVYFKNCCFDGSLLGPGSYCCGGFVGGNYKSANISNSLFAPTSVTMSTNYSSTFSCYSNPTIDNCYYTQAFGTEQGTAVGSMSNANLQAALGKQWEIKNNKVVPVIDVKNLSAGSVVCKTGFLYTGSEISVVPTVKDMDGNTVAAENYTVSFSPSPVKEIGNYTMTITGNASKGYSGTLTHHFRVMTQLNGKGTQTEPYTIASTSDWNKFVGLVNGGYSYLGEYVQLTENITVSTMAGVREDGSAQLLDCPFSGTFDGYDHTLTAAIVSTASGTGVNEQGVAPFHFIKHATIKNLTVAGSITSDSQYAGGLVGWSASGSSSEKNTITDCVVTATLTIGANYAGGFVGHVQPNGSFSDNYTYFTNCVFAGTIKSSSSEQRTVGGFFGYGDARSYFTNCLENGSYTNIITMNPRGANNTYYNNNVESLYYVNRIGSIGSYITEGNGCHQVVTAIPAKDIYLTRTIKGYTIYQPAILNNLMETYAYNNGETVSISGYSLKMGKTAMTENTDYTVTIKNSSNETVAPEDLKEVGAYTIHFTAKEGNAAGFVGESLWPFRIMGGESLDGYVFATEGEGDSKKYLINDESDLMRLSAYVNSGHDALGKTFKLNADITLTAEFTPIGQDTKFKGTFDGNFRKISNLTITDKYTTNHALFGNIKGTAVIKDLTIDGYNILGKSHSSVFAGSAEGTDADNRCSITNCHAKNGGIYATSTYANEYGGIVGTGQNLYITNCTMSGVIQSIPSNEQCGGIIGRAMGNVTVESCENSANIIGAIRYTGGIVGSDWYNTNRYINCLNTGTVEESGDDGCGGIGGGNSNRDNYVNCYYAYPCNKGAIDGLEYPGKGEKVYLINTSEHITSITATAEGSQTAGPTITSKLSNKNYYKKGNWTLIMGIDENYTFIKYTCEGGTLTNLDTASGEHALTISKNDVTINAIVSSNSGIDIAQAIIEEIPDQRWRGNDPVIPTLTVTYNNTELILGTDYIVEGTSNTKTTSNTDQATVTVKGINRYKGSQEAKFNIVDFPLLDPNSAYSSSNPYVIATEADLEALASIVNSGARSGGVYRQTADIVCTGEHTAIGNSDHKFQGTFDGKNGDTQHTITNLTINKPDERYQGLFGLLSGAIVKNVVLVNCNITGAEFTGGIAGHMNCSSKTLDNCTVSGAIKVADGKYYDYHGGVVGYLLYGTIDHCVNTASVTGTGGYHGGIVGEVSSTTALKNCFNAGTVEGTSYVGSLTGNKNGNVLTSYHTSATTGGVGAYGKSTGTDQDGAELVVKISAGAGVTITYPTTPTYIWNEENLYKSGTAVTLDYDLPDGKFFDCYTVNSGEISNAGIMTGEHTLTGFTEDVVISGSYVHDITLADNDSQAAAADKNSAKIADNIGEVVDVMLSGRTLYKDGEWNTICLPFNVELANSPLAGATAKTLTNATMTGTHVTLTFGNAVTTLAAGKPYIIKWENNGDENIVNPVFTGVKIVSTTETERTIEMASGNVKFIGYYDAFDINTPDDDDIYYMTSGSLLKHTAKKRTLKACRAYFQFSEAATTAREFILDFGEDGASGIMTVDSTDETDNSDGWYTVDGKKLDKQPTRKGLYIKDGRKVVVK